MRSRSKANAATPSARPETRSAPARRYDYIVCGAGSSGSVVARRLAERGDASVLLIQAGGTDLVSSVTDSGAWFTNLGTERDWGFVAEPNEAINGRCLPLPMGKVVLCDLNPARSATKPTSEALR